MEPAHRRFVIPDRVRREVQDCLRSGISTAKEIAPRLTDRMAPESLAPLLSHLGDVEGLLRPVPVPENHACHVHPERRPWELNPEKR